MPWRTALLAPLVVVIAALVWFLPALTRDREVIAASPQPPPLFHTAPIELLLSKRVCSSPVAIDRHTDVARMFGARYAEGPPAHFEITVTAPGYRVARSITGYADGGPLDVPLPDPPRPLDAEICVENVGNVAGMVVGSAEPRTWGRAQTKIPDRAQDRRLVIRLLSEPPASVASRLGSLVDHAASLTPGFAPPGVLVVLALLVVLGLPAGAALALRRSGVEADRGQAEGGQVQRDEPA